LEGGCQLALGAAADETGHGLRLSAFLGTADPAAPRRIVVAGHDGEAVLVAVESFLRGEAQHDVCGRRTRVWISRESERAGAFRSACDESLFDVWAVPTFYAIEAGSKDAHTAAARNLDSYDWVFLTSQIAVQRFAEILREHGVTLGERPRLAAIGHKTAAAIVQQGWKVSFISDVPDAHALAESFADAAGEHVGRILFPCARVASDTLQTEMAVECDGFERLVCYDTREHPQLAASIAALPDPDAIVFTSPQAARFLIARRPVDNKVVVVAIGPATTEALLAAGSKLVYESPERSLEGTAEVINGLFTAPATPPLAPYTAHT
ncbi:MAG TPA: uroporphyrinogen-III synthase, partial [Acidobacteriota bacterium]|nr:uroporphyrinogen-III synthase [Acidobacteriota bacterium]